MPNKLPPDEAAPKAGVVPNKPVDGVVVVVPNSPPYTSEQVSDELRFFTYFAKFAIGIDFPCYVAYVYIRCLDPFQADS